MFVFVDDHSDEPLLSGSGVIDGNVEDSQLLERWTELIASWRSLNSQQQRPPQLRALVVGGGREGPRGVPESVRGQVWPLLARTIPASALLADALLQQRKPSVTGSPAREPRPEATMSTSTSNALSSDARPMSVSLNGVSSYQELSARECSGELDLQKDLARTFPQHEFFRQPEAAGQAALHRLCRVRTLLLFVRDEI